MELAAVTEILRSGILVALKITAPVLIISMLVGVIISIFQAATQINEQTLSFVPKLIVIIVVLIILGPWMGSVIMDYFGQILTLIGA